MLCCLACVVLFGNVFVCVCVVRLVECCVAIGCRVLLVMWLYVCVFVCLYVCVAVCVWLCTYVGICYKLWIQLGPRCCYGPTTW